jgi:hypothetical protein
MTDPRRPLPLPDVYAIVESRRRRRAKVRAIATPAAAVGAAGVAALVVVAIQTGAGTPAAPAASPPAALATSPTMPATTPATTLPEPTPAAPTTAAPPFDAGWLHADFLPGLAGSVFNRPDAEQAQLLDQADTLARAWGVPMYPAAKAVVAKADTTGTRIDPTDRRGADKLINRFQAAGYSEDYAKQLARAWNTDPRTAEIVGALVIDAGCCE